MKIARAFFVMVLGGASFVACAQLKSAGDTPSSPGGDDQDAQASGDAPNVNGEDAGTPSTGVDASSNKTKDAGTSGNDAGNTPPTDAGNGTDSSKTTGLDPGVPIPDLSLPPCSQPTNPSECGGVSACRMATPDSGRCVDCNVPGNCQGLITTPCATAVDCDVDLQCFRGTCVIACSLPSGPECGMPNHCVDVGYVNDRGLCDPAFLQ